MNLSGKTFAFLAGVIVVAVLVASIGGNVIDRQIAKAQAKKNKPSGSVAEAATAEK